MKRLLCLVVVAFTCKVPAQTFTIRNANQEYVTSSLISYDVSKKGQVKIVKDDRGIYWFQSLIEIFSFDGINWKPYKLRTSKGKNTPFRLNDIEVLNDGSILLATESGIYIFDRDSEIFLPLNDLFPVIKKIPLAVSCFYKGTNDDLVFVSAIEQGFYLLDWKTKRLQHIFIDSVNRVFVPGGEMLGITMDKSNNIWGITNDNRGIWNYDHSSGKLSRSWKGELLKFADKRFQYPIGITYAANEDALWLSYGSKGWLEKKNLQTNKSLFYSFSGDLKVHQDTLQKSKYPVYYLKIDRNNNEWIRVGEKYLVKLNNDLTKIEYMVNDEELLSIGDIRGFEPEKIINKAGIKEDNVLLWIQGAEKMSMIKRRNDVIRHIAFDTLPMAGIHQKDFDNSSGRFNVFFERGRNDNYFLLQQNENRPKVIYFDKDLRVRKVLLNDELKKYPSYFSQVFDPDTFYVAIMRPGNEPLDFRNVVLKDIKIDLNTFKVEEIKPNFKGRVRRYGMPDVNNIYWLFSNGTLYSYDPIKDHLDSVYICKPAEKGGYAYELVKGYDYPTVLHKPSSTFWIDFIPARELYKIDLKTKKIVKIFKCCFDKVDCNIPGGVFDMYNFDGEHIYLQQSFAAKLVNVKNDSLTDYFDLFKNSPSIQNPSGSGLYKDWAYFIFPSHIYFFNTVSQNRKDLLIDEDFKWKISQLNCKPLINDHGEMILLSSNKGFLVFNIDSLAGLEKPGNVNLSFIKLDNRNLSIDSLMRNKGLFLGYNNYNSIQIGFSDHSIFNPGKVNYEYTLYKNGDTVWNKIEGKPELTLSELSPGKYKLLLRAVNAFGDHSNKITSFGIEVTPPFRQTLLFKLLIISIVSAVIYALYRYRVQQLKRLEIIRNNIASDLHDDIGSTLNSISIYSEVAKQQAGKEIPALDMIGINSRKIIESMSDIVWTINPENDSFEKIIVRMRSFAHQLLRAKKVEYTFDVDEKLNSIALPMQVRKNFYLVFKEAVTNIIKYSKASRVSISLTEKNKTIFLKIRDNGVGIPVNPETMGNGLMNMSKRASEIHAELNINSANGEGTEIELMLKT